MDTLARYLCSEQHGWAEGVSRCPVVSVRSRKDVIDVSGLSYSRAQKNKLKILFWDEGDDRAPFFCPHSFRARSATRRPALARAGWLFLSRDACSRPRGPYGLFVLEEGG